MTTDLQKATKGFFDRPEGKTGMVFIAALVAAAGYGLYWALPYIITLLENTLYASLLGAGVFLLTSPLWSTQVRTLVTYLFRSAMRGITGWFIEIDPIGILKNYVEDLRKNLATMNGQIGNLRGHITKLQGIIAKNEAEAEKSLKLAGVAKQQDQKAAFVLNARKEGRLRQSNMTLKDLLAKMQALYGLLNKLRETSDIMTQDMENEIEVKEQERNAIQAGYGAFTSAMKVLKGDPDKRALFDQAMEHLATNYAAKVGEIEHFMDISQGFIASVDLENGVFEQEALDRLEQQLDKHAESLLLGPASEPLSAPRTLGQLPDEARRVAAANAVEGLFNKK